VEDPTTIDSLIAAVARTPQASDAAVASAIALKHGDVLGTSYVIEEEIGRGGMGVVYRATDKTLGREVAIKVMRADRWPSAAQPEVTAIFEREARATAKLKHPSIVTAYHAGQDASGVLFLVLELLRGESLHQRLLRGAVQLDDAIAITEEVADAVAHAHGHGILHRDLKPQNVYLCEDHRVCLLDFGLAALRDAGSQVGTQSRSGTPSSMAPEQWRGEAQDERTDVWAMGLLLYRMVKGVAPPEVASDADLVAWLGAMSFSGVPAPVERVIRRATAHAPADRYPSARAFLTAVRKARPGRSTAVPVAQARESRRKTLTLWIAFGTAVAIASGGVIWYLSRRSPPPAKLRPEQKAGRYAGEFGEIIFEIHGDRVRGAYQHDRGLIEGRMVGDELIAVWCEEPTRRMPVDGGELRFLFMLDAEGRTLADGRWRYGRDGGWDERWDMYRLGDRETDPALRTILDDQTIHCPDAK
jgi:hypothetical protein